MAGGDFVDLSSFFFFLLFFMEGEEEERDKQVFDLFCFRGYISELDRRGRIRHA